MSIGARDDYKMDSLLVATVRSLWNFEHVRKVAAYEASYLVYLRLRQQKCKSHYLSSNEREDGTCLWSD